MTHVTCRLTTKNQDQLREPYAWQSSMGYLYRFLIIVATLVKTVPLVQIGMYSSVLVSGNSIDCDVRINLQYEMLRVVCVLLHDL